MTPAEMKQRTRKFALRVIKLVDALPRTMVAMELGRQLLKSGTSVAANYRAACRGKSHADFIAKLGIVEEECDESIFWIETLTDAGLVRAARVRDLCKEAEEILKIVVASILTARSRMPRRSKSAIRNPQSAIGAPRG